jgi:hypothetical protein
MSATALEKNGTNVEVFQCGNCDFFILNKPNPLEIGKPLTLGMCRRKPPVPLVMMMQDKHGNVGTVIQSTFPTVPVDQFCYEHSGLIPDADDLSV